MQEMMQALVNLFMESGKAHHQAYIETDGADPEWPLWYADYLMDKLPPLLGTEMTKSELVYLLVHLSKIQPVEAPDTPWPEFYARCLVDSQGK